MFVTKQISLSRASTQIFAYQHITVLQWSNVIHCSGIYYSSEAHEGTN